MGRNFLLNGGFDSPVSLNSKVTFGSARGGRDIMVEQQELPDYIVGTVQMADGVSLANICQPTAHVYGDHVSIVGMDGIEIERYSTLSDASKHINIDNSAIHSYLLEEDYVFSSLFDYGLTLKTNTVIDLNGHKLSTTRNNFVLDVSNGARVHLKNGQVVCNQLGFNVSDGVLRMSNLTVLQNGVANGSDRLLNLASRNCGPEAHAVGYIDRDVTINCTNYMNGAAIFLYPESLDKFAVEGEDGTVSYVERNKPTLVFNGKLYVNSGSMDRDKYAYGICTNGTTSLEGAIIILNEGAVVEVDNGPGIHIAGRDRITLNGGTVTGSFCGIDIRAGTLLVPQYSTAVVHGTGEDGNANGWQNGWYCGHFGGQGAGDFNTGDALIIESSSYGSNSTFGFPVRPPSVSIFGGTFISDHGNPIGSYAHSKIDAFTEYTDYDLNLGKTVAGGGLGVVGKFYRITGGTQARSNWNWFEEVDINNLEYYERLTGFVRGGLLSAPPSDGEYGWFLGDNASKDILFEGKHTQPTESGMYRVV